MGAYWAAIHANIESLPVEFCIGAVFGMLIDKPFRKWWSKHFGVRAELADIKEVAEGARVIAADLFEHHTGGEHPVMNGLRSGSTHE